MLDKKDIYMKNIISQGITVIGSFFLLWLLLGEINWMDLFNVEKNTSRLEKELGELIWKSIKDQNEEIKDSYVIKSIDSLTNILCNSNNIDRNKIKVHVVRSGEVNAFALPDGHLVIMSQLILNAEDHGELAGVICHEIAHIEKNHVMKKLIKELGLTALISMTSNSGGEVISQAGKIVSSSAFDRTMERDADIQAVKYLQAAKINPESFAHFLYRLSDSEPEAMKYLTWLSTHPDSKERAEYVIEESLEEQVEYTSVIADETWEKIKDILRAN